MFRKFPIEPRGELGVELRDRARQYEAFHELADDVLSVRRAAAVAARHDLAARAERLNDCLERVADRLSTIAECGIPLDERFELVLC